MKRKLQRKRRKALLFLLQKGRGAFSDATKNREGERKEKLGFYPFCFRFKSMERQRENERFSCSVLQRRDARNKIPKHPYTARERIEIERERLLFCLTGITEKQREEKRIERDYSGN